MTDSVRDPLVTGLLAAIDQTGASLTRGVQRNRDSREQVAQDIIRAWPPFSHAERAIMDAVAQRDEWQAIAGALAEALRDADHCHPLESRCLCGRWNTEDCEPDPKGTAHAALARYDAAKERP